MLLEQYLDRSYNPQVGLYREAPNVAPNTYWVCSDGYLAGADISRWKVPVPARWTVLVGGATVDENVFAYGHRVIDVDQDRGVRAEADDPAAGRLDDWPEYADRLLLAATNARNAGNYRRASQLIAAARGMWNGKGMADKVHRANGYYETYKTVLYYYLTGDLRAREIILSLQERDASSNRYGGIYTEYGEDLRPLSQTDTNTETAAITLRALRRYLPG